jgi:hypothetical protein
MMKRRKEFFSEAIFFRTTKGIKRAIELEAERQHRCIGEMVRIIVIEWDRERERRAMTEPAK